MALEWFDGRDSYLIYAEETSYGAGGTLNVANHFGKVQSITVDMDNSISKDLGLGEGINYTKATLGSFNVSGTVSTMPVDFTFLQYGVGDRSGAGSTASPYLLSENTVFGYSASQTPSLKMRVGNKGQGNDQTLDILGTYITQWTLDGEQGKGLMCNFNYVGKTVLRATTIDSYTEPSGRPYYFLNGSFVWGASDTLRLSKFSISCGLNNKESRPLFTRFRDQPTFGIRTYDWTLTIEKNYDDTGGVISAVELMSEFFQDTNAPKSSGTITGDAMTITVSEGSASNDQVLIIQLENSFINKWTENPTLEGGKISITVNGFSLAGKTNGALKQPISWYSIT